VLSPCLMAKYQARVPCWVGNRSESKSVLQTGGITPPATTQNKPGLLLTGSQCFSGVWIPESERYWWHPISYSLLKCAAWFTASLLLFVPLRSAFSPSHSAPLQRISYKLPRHKLAEVSWDQFQGLEICCLCQPPTQSSSSQFGQIVYK